MTLPLENLINVGFIPNIWQVMIIIPYITLEDELEQNLDLTSEHLSGFKKYLICRGKNKCLLAFLRETYRCVQ